MKRPRIERLLCHISLPISSNLFIGVHYEMLAYSEDGYEFEWLLQNYESHNVGEKVGMYVQPQNIQIMHKPESQEQEVMDLDEI